MKSRLNIAFFGSSLVSAYWNGAATYYRGIIRALDQLGHSVTFYEPDAYDRQKHRDIADPDWARVVVYQTRRHRRCLSGFERRPERGPRHQDQAWSAPFNNLSKPRF